jgi:hypothetical protein
MPHFNSFGLWAFLLSLISIIGSSGFLLHPSIRATLSHQWLISGMRLYRGPVWLESSQPGPLPLNQGSSTTSSFIHQLCMLFCLNTCHLYVSFYSLLCSISIFAPDSKWLSL